MLTAVRDVVTDSTGGPDAAPGEGVTVGDVVDRLGGHPNTVRHHLSALLEDDLLEVAPALTGRRGRPATRYRTTALGQAADDGRAELVEEYVALAAAFAERLAERGGDPGDDARSIGHVWGATLSAREAAPRDHRGRRQPATSRREAVVGMLSRLGFSPAIEPRGARALDGATVLLRTCPLLESARRHPEVICRVHLGLVEGVFAGQGEPASDVALEPFARPGACVLTLPPESPA
ncbi:helix-turn-helix domain-containing protein [Terrabacter aeriphilus]|uniref:Helix-turn-helix domain-containing protein n=1 Tax=Terrabacter aeriphilus TaxID=515662 RepID=A0ABP9JF19_9MICO